MAHGILGFSSTKHMDPILRPDFVRAHEWAQSKPK